MVSVPAFIRSSGVDLGAGTRAYIRRKVAAKLAKFNVARRVSVRVEDVNGPRGGVDYACRIKAVLDGHPSVVFEMRSASVSEAIDGALAGVAIAVRRTVARRRARPIRGGRHAAAALRRDRSRPEA
ncbi:MAG TPA: HPF/RaiA family ribosome-associated protein [Gammaproteobacteria bacterium]|nr:HPF/RaiA family ribosome-associated protein [Gammaproteobacteria bacterium]